MRLSDRCQRRADRLAVRSVVRGMMGRPGSSLVLGLMATVKRAEAGALRKVGL